MAGSLILSGNQFHIAGPATEKARLLPMYTTAITTTDLTSKLTAENGRTYTN